MACTVMYLCCRCNARGKCRNCTCVKSKRPCSTGLPFHKGCCLNMKLFPAMPAVQVSAMVSDDAHVHSPPAVRAPDNAHVHSLPAVQAPDDAHVHSLPAEPAVQVSAMASDDSHARLLSAVRVSLTPGGSLAKFKDWSLLHALGISLSAIWIV